MNPATPSTPEEIILKSPDVAPSPANPEKPADGLSSPEFGTKPDTNPDATLATDIQALSGGDTSKPNPTLEEGLKNLPETRETVNNVAAAQVEAKALADLNKDTAAKK